MPQWKFMTLPISKVLSSDEMQESLVQPRIASLIAAIFLPCLETMEIHKLPRTCSMAHLIPVRLKTGMKSKIRRN